MTKVWNNLRKNYYQRKLLFEWLGWFLILVAVSTIIAGIWQGIKGVIAIGILLLAIGICLLLFGKALFQLWRK